MSEEIKLSPANYPTGKSADFATGKPVNISKPEEKVRQEYEKILVNDYEYEKEQLDIEVRIKMGSSTKYADIGIYNNAKKEKIIGLVETKAKDKGDGEAQLTSYMSATNTCKFGILVSDDTLTVFIRNNKNEIEKSRKAVIPTAGRINNVIDNYSQLKPATNLKMIFKNINSHLRTEGQHAAAVTRGNQILKMIFCKLLDETEAKEENRVPQFQIFDNEETEETATRIRELFKGLKDHHRFGEIFKSSEFIELADDIIEYIVARLQTYTLFDTDNDVVGEAFQIFAEKQHAGESGQFFTPRPLVNALVKMVHVGKKDTVIDTACGSGGFLLSALEAITGNSNDALTKRDKAEAQIFGIDVDPRLVTLGKAYMSMMGDGKCNIAEANSLKKESKWGSTAKGILIDKDNDEIKKFDKILSNPPFGTKKEVQIKDKETLKLYDLGHKWKKNKGADK